METVATVPTLWPGETCVILASGPSLCAEDVEFCRGRARVLAIKDAIRLAPWADCLYGCDGRWWETYGPSLRFDGPKYTLDRHAARWATVLRNTGETGLELDPTGLRTGKNSGSQAINLAVHCGALKIVLLGYDMTSEIHGPPHWFGWHPYRRLVPPYRLFLPLFQTLLAPLKAAGVIVINASRISALEAFPKMSLAEALA